MKTYPLIPLFLITLSAGLVCAPLAQADSLAARLQQLKTYKFGQDTHVMKAVEAEVEAARANPAQRPELARRLAQFLTTDATYAAKQFVCRQLVLIADPREAPVLEKLLTDGHLAPMALYAMMPIPGPAVTRALIQAIHRTTGLDQIGVITALGERHDPQAVTPLGALLRAENAAAAEAAGSALARIGTVSAANALTSAWREADAPRKTAFARDCLACAGQLKAANMETAAEDLYETLYSQASDPIVHAGALRGLALMRGHEGWRLAIASLERGARPTRRAAAALLLELPAPVPVSLFRREMSHVSPQGQVYLLSVLTERDAKSALPLAKELVASTEPIVRLAALAALGPLGDASSVGVLEHYAVEGSPQERATARASLRRVSGAGVNEAMMQALDGAATAERIELIRTLGDRGARQAVDSILPMVRDSEPGVRQAAWEVLGELSGPRELPKMVDLLLTVRPGERDTGVQTVAAIARQGATEEERTGIVLRRLAPVSSSPDRRSLLQVLGLIGGPKALKALRGELTQGPEETRLTVLRVLAAWPTDAPMQDLLNAARQARDTRMRTIALRGFLNQLRLDASLSPERALADYREAMGLAADRSQKAAVLSGVATLRTKAGLDLAASKLDDAEVRQEAAVALVQLGRDLCGAYPGEVRLRMRQVLASSPGEVIAAKAKAVLEQLGRFGDYLAAWQVSPPYTKAGASATALFDMVFPPEQPGSPGVPWEIMPAGTNAQQPWLLDLESTLGGNDRVAYLRTDLHSDRDQILTLELGSDDGIKVWLNGRLILAHNVMRAIAPGQEKVKVRLRQGWNPLLLKITQNNMGWGACARLCNPDGSPAQGVRAAVRGGNGA
jgi:HEAT repeat protein